MEKLTQNTLLEVCFGVTAMFLAWLLVRKFRRFFEWQKGDTFMAHWSKASEEYKKDRQASINMFGSNAATNTANFVNFFAGLAAVLLMARVPVFAPIFFGYLAVGFSVTRKVVDAAKTEDYARLLIADRIWFRSFYALGWPYWATRKNKNGDSK